MTRLLLALALVAWAQATSAATLSVCTAGLPSPWLDADVGAVGVAGSSSYSAGTFTVLGAGADIFGTVDAFHFVYQTLLGDGQIIARVVTEQNTNQFAKAGIMLRASLAADAAHVLMDRNPGNNIEFQTRATSGATTTNVANDTQALPAWVRLIRTGTQVSGAVSSNGTTWRTLGTVTWSATSPVYVGLLVLSHDVAALNTSTFSNVSVTGGSGTNAACTYSSVQTAVNAAACGDTITLGAGQSFTESVTLPNKGVCTDFITITTDADPSLLPASGVRISPSAASLLPKIRSPGGGANTILTAAGAHHYQFLFIEFPGTPGGFNAIMALGTNDSSQQFESQEPTDITVDRCWLHGNDVAGQKLGIGFNGKRIIIINSYIEKMNALAQDSQCVGSAGNGHGPVTVENNFLRCGTENALVGGDDPWIRTYMSATGSASTTGAAVATSEAGHTLAELQVGQILIVQTAGGTKHEETIIRSVTGSGATGSLTWDAISAAPDLSVASSLRAGVVLDGFTFRFNYVAKDPAWLTGVFPLMSGVSATASAGGTLGATTRVYVIQPWSTQGYNNNTVHGGSSAEVTATTNGTTTNTITVQGTAVSGAETYRVYRGTTAGGENQFATVTTLPFVDDGSVTYTAGTPTSASLWSIKNLFEIKAATHVQVDSNIFEFNWRGASLGFAWWMKSADQGGGCWWCKSSDIVMENNIIRHVSAWLEVNGHEVPAGSGFVQPPPLSRLTVRNNLVYDSGFSPYIEGIGAYAMQFANGARDVLIDHNTVVHNDGGQGLMGFGGEPAALVNWTFTNNLFWNAQFGIHSSLGNCAAGLNVEIAGGGAPSWTYLNNATAGASAGICPPTNFYPTSAALQSEFVAFSFDGTGADYHLKPTSRYRLAATDGLDPGANIDLLTTETTVATTGTVPVPTNVRITQSGTATFGWTAAPGATSYQLEIGTSSGATDQIVMNVGNVTTYVLGLPSGHYFWRVRAIIGGVTAGPSAEVYLEM